MEKKLLIAVDGSPASRQALSYVAMMESAVILDLSVTLFHLATPIPEVVRQEMELRPESFQRLRQMEGRYLEQGRRILDKARLRLLDLGLAPDKVQQKLQVRAMGRAKDILFEGERGLYDAVVLGRRGLTGVEEMFLGSITNKVVQHADRLPVWVVGGAVNSCRILCAVDSSEGSLKAVDHLAFMLAGNQECELTLFHAGPGAEAVQALAEVDAEEAAAELSQEDLSQMAGFFERARALLRAAGLADSQVRLITREGVGSVWRAVLEELRQGGYGTVVLGRRGEGRSFWLGHVSDKIVARAADCAVWIVG